jgi:acetolactate synthase-1/3 small subunit
MNAGQAETKPQDKRRVLAILLDNEAGALMRVVNLFSSRGYNIDSLTVSEADESGDVSRITVTTHAPDRVISHIIHLLEKLVPVHRVEDLSAAPHVERGLMLLKVSAEGAARTEILHIAGEFGARLAHADPEFFILQLTDTQEMLTRFASVMRQYGILEYAGTGVTALSALETLQDRRERP